MEKDTLLSSKNLFHFTQKRSLKGILKKGFHPRYSLEKIAPFYDEKRNETHLFYPMVCFCDIPIEHSKTHRRIYGKYGIGLSKKWAEEAGVNPVIYINLKSKLVEHFTSLGRIIDDTKPDYFLKYLNWARDAHKYLTKQSQEMNDDLKFLLLLYEESKPEDVYKQLGIRQKLISIFYELIRYVKPYIGSFEYKKYKNPFHKFYDEREWRYVPPLNTDDNVIRFPPFIDDGVPPELKKAFNKDIPFVPFDEDYVEYIIVKKKNEIEEFKIFLSDINRTCNKKYNLRKIRIKSLG
jgi:hypothetical protein